MIELRNIKKSYEKNIVLEDFTLHLERGLIHSLYGESGSGKSTILNIIGLIDSKYTGDLIIDGTNFNPSSQRMRSKYIRYNISYLFQNYALIHDTTVKDNLSLALDYVPESKKTKLSMIEEALDKVHLFDKLNDKVYMLSGGEQQRIALARTMLKPSRIILADEPTGNLDHFNRDIVLSHIKDMKASGKTIIIATHDPHVMAICDKNYEILKKEADIG